MDTILVVGTETVVGANLAAHYAERHDVVAHSCGPMVKIEGCRTVRTHGTETDLIAAARPRHVVYCGVESRSSWDATTETALTKSSPNTAAEWAKAAAAAGATFTMISSDACFTGPWIFHDEESNHVCPSPAANRIRAAEKAVSSVCPTALIVRTNAFGWSPTGTGWIEQVLQTIEQRRVVNQDPFRHSTPILATDLADIVERALNEGLTGTFHVAGAERVSPMNFAQRLADHFDLPWLSIRRDEPVAERAEGFGVSECSLQTKKIRKELCVAMPMLSEGLDRLSAQRFDGHRDLMVDRTHEAIAA